MAYSNPYHVERHVHNELVGLTELLGIDVKSEAAPRLQAVQEEADDAWASDPASIEFARLDDARDQNNQRRTELNALVAAEERKAKEATRAGSYADSRAADSRLKELGDEVAFCNSHGTTLANEIDRFQRKAERAHQDCHRRFASNVRQKCESEHTEKLARFLELIRSQPDAMELLVDLAIVDAIHIAYLP